MACVYRALGQPMICEETGEIINKDDRQSNNRGNIHATLG